MISSFPVRASFLAVFLTLVGAVEAQDTGQEAVEAEPFVESVNVEIVNIDVWVTDKSGEPVEDLSRDDFIVLRDGEPVQIENFYAVSGGRPRDESEVGLDSRGSEAGARPRPGAGGFLPFAEIAPEHRLWVIVFFDNYNIDPNERGRILPDLYQFLGRVVEGRGRAMLVSYQRSLEVRQPFTDDISRLADALAEIKDDSGLATIRKRDRIEALSRIDEADDPGEALLAARLYAEEQMNAVDFTVSALSRFVDTLAGLPGRKALVYVSSGVPMLAGEEVFQAVGEKFDVSEAYGEIPRHALTREFEHLGRVANAHRVAFHTVDAGGLRGNEFGAAEYGGFVDPRMRMMLDSVVPENLQAPLRFMAAETGGRAILNRNEILPALDEVRQDFGSFYSLGISSVDSESGRYHSIEVKLAERERGVRLRHRSGYRSKSVEARVQESLRSALLYDHQSNALGIDMRWGRPARQEGGDRYLMPIQVAVPMRDIVLLPTFEGKQEAKLLLFVGAVDADGGISEVDVVPFGIRLAEKDVEAARAESLLRGHSLLLGKGRQKLGVAVLDVFGGQSSIVTRMVQVGPVEPEAPELGR